MKKINEAIAILKAFGLPKKQQNERSGLTLLALLDIKKTTPWHKAKERNIGIHDIIVFMSKNYDKHYAENSRETIRRQSIHQFEQAGIVVRNADDPARPTNSGLTVYSISLEALAVIHEYGSPNWSIMIKKFVNQQGKLIEKYERRKKEYYIPLRVNEEIDLSFSPGKHNLLQAKIVSEFSRRFCPNTKVLYVGDTAQKLIHIEEEILESLNVSITKHDKLPDVVLYDTEANVLFLIEAVTSHGPVSPKRQLELEKVFKKSSANRIYISAFLDFAEFKRHIGNIAWDTEVWIENNPDHMIHFNGPKFFTLYEE